ncbi:MAG: RNB domain-containing ribonuclease, partial [Bacteroidetes bacterium]|nr:RNB domain-containing ribonuclease [Bacteroidota bacterium]
MGIKDEIAALEFLINIGLWDKNEDPVFKRFAIKKTYSQKVISESSELICKDISYDRFLDITKLELFSIDDENTKDMDDALSVELLNDKTRIGVHISNVTSVIESSDDDWNLSTSNVNVTINPNNITLKRNDSNQYPNQTGNFTSLVIFVGPFNRNFTLISWKQEVPYQKEIGRAAGDGNDASDEDGFINTSGLVLLFHFNNESAFGEATAEAGLSNKTVDYSIYVNSERAESNANNGSFFGGATINKTDYKFGGGSAEF